MPATTPSRSFTVDSLRVSVYPTGTDLAVAAASEAAETLRQAIEARGEASVILRSTSSQAAFLTALAAEPVDWAKVRVFHTAEYLGLPVGHPAALATAIDGYFIARAQPGEFYAIDSHAKSVVAECARYEALLRRHHADLCCLGIGENGRIGFNEPGAADFADPVLVKTVRLDERSRRQQLGEGHYSSLDEVPTHAITLTVPALMAAKHLVCIVPQQRKAEAAERSLRGPVGEDCPATALRSHPSAQLLLDEDSASRL